MIRIHHVTHLFKKESTKQEVKALDDVSLDIMEGEHIAVLGHNGCGKSTLAKHLNALLLPTVGTVEVDAVDTANEADLWNIRQTVGMVFQNPDNQLVATTVEEDVAFGPENMGMDPVLIRQRVDEALKLVGMEEFKNKGPHLLSGGQKQRIAIARAFIKNAPIVILDEATSALDNKSESVVQKAIENLMQDKTVFVIAHRLSTIRNATKIAVINEGHIVEQGTHDELIKNECGAYKMLYDMQFKTKKE